MLLNFANNRAKLERKQKKAFSFIEVIITTSLFLLLAGIGIGSYFQYYSFSLIKSDVDHTLTLVKQTRFKALKNPTNDNYGIHIDPVTRMITGFRDSYNPLDSENITIELEQLGITDLSLNPSVGVTNEILFETQTGKTQNSGSFTIGNDNYSYTININPQGVVN
ncbi:hypothetical protein KJ742_06575 [Patescibacteria group bacterium]|nr:hypothetical protein [Patescibacteria group bacterium]MBU1683577.1 hypothetical protein [Patescibacteria group bacterium]